MVVLKAASLKIEKVQMLKLEELNSKPQIRSSSNLAKAANQNFTSYRKTKGINNNQKTIK